MDTDTERGVYKKYDVKRRNDPDGKHDECSYFVLDLHHDVHARNALAAYADSCEDDYPDLASDLRRMLTGTVGFFRGQTVPFEHDGIPPRWDVRNPGHPNHVPDAEIGPG